MFMTPSVATQRLFNKSANQQAHVFRQLACVFVQHQLLLPTHCLCTSPVGNLFGQYAI